MNTKEILTQIEAINNRLSEKTNPIKCGCDGEWNCHNTGNLFTKECKLHQISLIVCPTDSAHLRYHIGIRGSIYYSEVVVNDGTGIERILEYADGILKGKKYHYDIDLDASITFKNKRTN